LGFLNHSVGNGEGLCFSLTTDVSTRYHSYFTNAIAGLDSLWLECMHISDTGDGRMQAPRPPGLHGCPGSDPEDDFG